MKTKLVLLIAALLSLNTSCLIVAVNDEWDDCDDSIRGSGMLQTEVRTLPDFNSVDMTTAGKVFISAGAEQQVSITVDDNIAEYITTSVRNGKLFIGTKSGVSVSNMNLTVNLTMTDLSELVASSAGSIIGKTKFAAQDVRLILSSAGTIWLELEANYLNSNLSSAGNLFLRGTVKEHYAVLSSAGNLCAFDLMADTPRIILSSAGNAEVHATRLLEATLSRIGSLFYKEHPTICQNISSKGRIINMNPSLIWRQASRVSATLEVLLCSFSIQGNLFLMFAPLHTIQLDGDIPRSLD